MKVSVLTDQVEAQGEKIRDLDLCLDEHREKLNATEEMLQQVCARVCHNSARINYLHAVVKSVYVWKGHLLLTAWSDVILSANILCYVHSTNVYL